MTQMISQFPDPLLMNICLAVRQPAVEEALPQNSACTGRPGLQYSAPELSVKNGKDQEEITSVQPLPMCHSRGSSIT